MNLAQLQQHKPQILAIAAEHHAANIRVFGSVARGDAKTGSDLDLLVQMQPEASLFDLAAMDRKITALVGMQVDVISDRALHPIAAPYILAEAKPL